MSTKDGGPALTINCLQCGKNCDRHTACNGSDRQPEVGDVLSCFGCGHLMLITKGGVRRLTETEKRKALEAMSKDFAELKRALDVKRQYQNN